MFIECNNKMKSKRNKEIRNSALYSVHCVVYFSVLSSKRNKQS